MESNQSDLQGLWLPLVTPFLDGVLDETSIRRLLKHYLSEPVDGLILAGTTGEGLTLDDEEIECLVSIALSEFSRTGKALPLYLGLTGSDTRKVIKSLERTASWSIDGYLIACPYYSRPSEEGLLRHFSALADSTARSILIYNIPYRTGVNLGNDAMLHLAETANIVGVKDCSADPVQSFDLLCRRASSFAVMTGEDAFFYDALTHGADGGILASAHLQTLAFADIQFRLSNADQAGALAAWRSLVDLPQLLFSEPSVASIKYWLWRIGLIDSPEVRLPMTAVSEGLAHRIDQKIEQVASLDHA